VIILSFVWVHLDLPVEVQVLILQFQIYPSPSSIFALTHLAFLFGKKCHMVGNDGCPFVFTGDFHEMPVVSGDVEGNGGQIS